MGGNASGASERGAGVLDSLIGGASAGQLHQFCSRIGTGMRAGVDLLRLLDTEAKSGSARYRQSVGALSGLVRGGHSLSEAMGLQSPFFPPLLVKMIHAGEESGKIDSVLRYMSDYYLDLKRTRQEFQSQVTKPLIEFFLAVLILCGMIFINGFFQGAGPGEPPFDITGVGLRGVSGVLIFLSILGGIGLVLGIGVFGIWKNWFGCHEKLLPLVRNVPVVGPVVTLTALSRLSMTLSMMLGAGVDAKRSVRDAVLSTGNHYYIAGLPEMESAIARGDSFSEAFDAPKRLPDDFIQTLEVGEMSGSDSESLERLSLEYREKLQLALKQLAVASSYLIWMLISGMIIAVIFMVFMQYLNMITSNLPK
jgi:type II secretory pathway component PulF